MEQFLTVAGFVAGIAAIVWFLWSRRAEKVNTNGKASAKRDEPDRERL